MDRLILGLAVSERDDEKRMARGPLIFEDLHRTFTRKGKGGEP